MSTPDLGIRIASIEAFCFRVPIRTPIRVAFGTFRDRPCVLVKVTDANGAVGWGEAWANWPAVGAEHRARLVTDLGERLIGVPFNDPQTLFADTSRALEVLTLQTGEIGPIAQAIAGIDIAVWDLVARRNRLPLHRLLSPTVPAVVPVYATGINPDEPERFVEQRLKEGHRAFKLKTGFGNDRDLRNLRAMREVMGPACELTCDANQSLSLEAAQAFCREAESIQLGWFEEPLWVDAGPGPWRALAQSTRIPLAGGENLQGDQFDTAIADKVLQVIQPDVTKWGGISGNHRVATQAVEAGKRYCPHYFGGGVSLLASLHLLAAAGGSGLLEFDCHPNAGREAIVGDLLPVRDGTVPVPQGPGLGAEPDLAALARYQTLQTRTP